MMGEEDRNRTADEALESRDGTRKPSLKSYALNIAMGLALAALRLFVFGRVTGAVTTALTTAQVFGELSDCFFIPGALLSGAGILSLMASRGTYDIFGFGLKTIGSHFSFKRDPQKFYDYRKERAGKRKGYLKGTLFTGLAFLAASILFLVAYLAVGKVG